MDKGTITMDDFFARMSKRKAFVWILVFILGLPLVPFVMVGGFIGDILAKIERRNKK